MNVYMNKQNTPWKPTSYYTVLTPCLNINDLISGLLTEVIIACDLKWRFMSVQVAKLCNANSFSLASFIVLLFTKKVVIDSANCSGSIYCGLWWIDVISIQSDCYDFTLRYLNRDWGFEKERCCIMEKNMPHILVCSHFTSPDKFNDLSHMWSSISSYFVVQVKWIAVIYCSTLEEYVGCFAGLFGTNCMIFFAEWTGLKLRS